MSTSWRFEICWRHWSAMACGLWNLGWDNCNAITKERTSFELACGPCSPQTVSHIDFHIDTLVVTELKLQMLTSALPRNSSAQPWRHPKSPHSSNWIGALNRQCSSEFRSPSPKKWRGLALDHRHMPSSVSKTLDSPPCCCIYFLAVWIAQIQSKDEKSSVRIHDFKSILSTSDGISILFFSKLSTSWICFQAQGVGIAICLRPTSLHHSQIVDPADRIRITRNLWTTRANLTSKIPSSLWWPIYSEHSHMSNIDIE